MANSGAAPAAKPVANTPDCAPICMTHAACGASARTPLTRAGTSSSSRSPGASARTMPAPLPVTATPPHALSGRSRDVAEIAEAAAGLFPQAPSPPARPPASGATRAPGSFSPFASSSSSARKHGSGEPWCARRSTRTTTPAASTAATFTDDAPISIPT